MYLSTDKTRSLMWCASLIFGLFQKNGRSEFQSLVSYLLVLVKTCFLPEPINQKFFRRCNIFLYYHRLKPTIFLFLTCRTYRLSTHLICSRTVAFRGSSINVAFLGGVVHSKCMADLTVL